MEREAINLLSESVPGAVFEVANSPGAGFLEKVYEKALLRELGIQGIRPRRRFRFLLVIRAGALGSILPTSWWKGLYWLIFSGLGWNTGGLC